MGESEEAQLARLEERVASLREDCMVIMGEVKSARIRLHNLEGIASTFSDAQRIARQKEEWQYRRLRFTISVLAVVIAIAAIFVPLVAANLIGK